MSTNSTQPFPAPVGGVPDSLDFAPSIVFAVLYALIAPIAIWRITHPRSRNTVLIGTTFFSVERVILFSLRANMARDPVFRANEGIETYIQTSLSGGFLAIGQDLVNLFRALLVASTLGGEMLARHKLTPPHVRKAQKRAGSQIELAPRGPAGKDGKGAGDETYEVELGVDRDAASARTTGSVPEFEDQTELRKTFRRWLGITTALFLIAMILSATAGGMYKAAVKGANGGLVRSLWYLSTGLGIALLLAAAVTAHVVSKKFPRVPRTSALLVVLVASFLSLVGIYRLIVISHSTTSLLLTGPGTHNTPSDKAAFYVLHAAPEYLATATLVSLNVRRVFGTGPFGDIRTRDPKPNA